MKFLLLSDISQVVHLARSSRRILASYRPMTQDLAVAHELERLGIPFCDEFAYISQKEIKENWTLANELAETWQRHLLPREMGDWPPGTLVNQELVYPLEVCLNARTIYRRILESEKISSITGYWLPSQAVWRTGPAPATRATATIAQAVLRWMAKERRIPIYSSQCQIPASVEVLGRNVTGPRTTSIKSDPIPRRDARVIVLLDVGLRARERDILAQHLAASGETRLVQISPWELASDGLFSKGTWTAEAVSTIECARRGLARACEEYDGSFPEIFANPYLGFQFQRVLDEIESAMRVASGFGAVLDCLKPSAVILGHDAFARERALVQKANERGIPTLSLIHTGLGHAFMARGLVGLADKLLVWGQNDIDLLRRYGVAPGRIKAVGSLQYEDKYRNPKSLGALQSEAKFRQTAKMCLNLANDLPVVVLLTASTSTGFAQIIADGPAHRKAWKFLVQLAETRPDINFVIKAHPSYDHYEFYRQIDKYGPRNLVFLDTVLLADVLAAADVAILMNYCTTAALEAMLAGVPLLFVRNALLDLSDWEDSLDQYGAIQVSVLAELEESLDRLLYDRAARASILSDSVPVLQRILGKNDQPVLPAIMRAVNDILLHPIGLPSTEDQTTFRIVMNIGSPHQAGASATGDSASLGRLLLAESDGSKIEKWDDKSLFSLSYSLGVSAESADKLLWSTSTNLRFVKLSTPLSTAVHRKFLVNAFLVAMTHAMDAGKWEVGRSFAWRLLTKSPSSIMRSPVFRLYLFKSLLVLSPLLWSFASFAGRMKASLRCRQRILYQDYKPTL